MGYIYKISNTINDKVYIGQTVKKRPTDRFSQHRYAARHIDKDQRYVSILHMAMAKHGVDNFLFEIVEEIENDKLNEREQYWIKYYDSITPNGYNITSGGGGTPGYARPQSLEERLKRQQSNKQFFIDHPEAREKYREQTKTLWKDDEYRKKVVDGLLNYHKNNPDAYVIGHSEPRYGKDNSFYGKHHTEETKQKLRESQEKNMKKVAQLDKDSLEVIKIHDNIRSAEREMNASHGWLSKAARYDRLAYGYRWKFI